MNAILSALIKKKKIILENDGKLLKKSFFGFLILSFAFQSGSFGEMVRQSMIDAYIQVSVLLDLPNHIYRLRLFNKYDVKSFYQN